MDYNGWHAVAGLALFGPGLVLCWRKSWAVLYLLLAAVAGALPGIWAFFSNQVAYIFAFPNNITDAIVAHGNRRGDAGGGRSADLP